MQQRGKIISVSIVKIDVKTCFLRALTILLMLLVIALVSACSSETHQLCNIRINLEEENSRSLSAEPLKNYTIYYKSIYRGSDPSKAYGDMSNYSYFKKLTTNGILVSQGLWEIQAIFKDTDQGDTYTPTNEDLALDLIATSGDIYINLNTKSIAVRFSSKIGYVKFSSYELRSIPGSVTKDTISVSVSVYKYDETVSAFSSTETFDLVEDVNSENIFAKENVQLDTGIYYAVVSVKGTVSNTSKTLFTDCIGFVVRSGLTTDINGYCDKYNTSSSSNVINVDTKGDNGKPTTESDLKNFNKDNFVDDGIYILPGNQQYILAPTEAGKPYEKVITDKKTVTIDMNGNCLVTNNKNNSEKINKAFFIIDSGSTLNLINSKVNSGSSPWFGSDGKFTARYHANILVNGGSFYAGTSLSNGQVAIRGCTPDVTPPNGEYRHAAIDISNQGGKVDLSGSTSGIRIEQAVRGISTDDNDTSSSVSFKVNIKVDNATIKTNGSSSVPNYGIYLDGTKIKTKEDDYIKITIGSPDPTDTTEKTISTSGSSTGNGYGIYIAHFSIPITIDILPNAVIYSKEGYGIYIDKSCTGTVTITNNGKIDISSKGKAAAVIKGTTYTNSLPSGTY